MLRRIVPLATLCIVANASPGLAQADAMAMARSVATNQLGLLGYCQSNGDVGADAVAAQTKVIAQLPASSSAPGDAEALGKAGTMTLPNGTSTTLSSLAGTHGVTVSALCKQMGSSTMQAAAAYQQNGMFGSGMPSVTGIPAMPAMPGMPGMPAYGATPPAR